MFCHLPLNMLLCSIVTLLNRFRVHFSLETAFKAFKNWYFDQNLGVGNEARFASFCFTLWWKIRILRILCHTMMKNTHFAYFVSRHDEKWQLFNGVKQNDAKRASCPTPKLWSKYQFLHYLKALKAVSRPESIQQCSQRWNKVTCSMVSDKTLRNHQFGELLDL